MAKAEYKSEGVCGVCHLIDEGIEITVWWFIKVFICEACISRFFRQFKKGV